MAGGWSLEELQRAIATEADRWRPLVFTNGCFDLLHAGHVRYLWAARHLGRSLVVGLNSDASVQALKPAQLGMPRRPIVAQEHRAEVLSALKPVDAVLPFDELTACSLITALRPDIYVKGGDYTLNTLPEAATVLAYGGRIELIPIEISISTTQLIQRILMTPQP